MVKQKNTSLTAVAILCVISLAVMFAALFFSCSESEPAVFTPPPFDENAVQGTPDVPEGMGWGEVDAHVYKASICGVVTVEDGKADVWFTNPESNTVWLKLRVLDANGNTLGETGLIRSGEYVQSVLFETIPEVGDSIGLKLMAYEPETYYSAGSATLNTTVKGGEK
jgi:hypothetical protein